MLVFNVILASTRPWTSSWAALFSANAEKNNIPYSILKDPGSEADNKFRATMKGGN